MAESHIAALLPTQNRVLSVDESTTFLAHYDLNEHDVLRNIKAIGEINALSFGGTTYMDIPNFGLTANITVQFWVNWTTTANSTLLITNPQGFAIGFYQGNKIILTTTSNRVANLTGFVSGNWNHVAVTYDASGIPTCYINGVETTYDTVNNYWANPGSYIGRRTTGDYFLGSLMRMSIWNRQLSLDEIKICMNNSIQSESGLLAYWKLNEGNGSIAQGLSDSHDDLLINNGTWITGNSVFTLRPKEGYFGGSAIAIEESTTNYMVQAPSGWRPTPVGVDSTTYKGYPVYYADGISGGSGWYHSNNAIVELAVGAKAVYSMWINRGTANTYPGFYPQGQTFDGTTWTSRDPINTGYAARTFEYFNVNGDSLGSSINYATFTGWVKVVVTFTNTHTDKIRLTNIFFLDYNYTSGRCYHSQPQMELKSFPTSFVSGTRTGGNLKYPTSIINPIEGTINCWVYVDSTGAHSASANWAMAYSIVEIISSPYGERNQISLRKYVNSTDWSFVSSDNAGNSTRVSVGSPSKGWHMFTVSWGNGTLNGYLDGVLINTTSNATLPSNFDNAYSNGFILGSWTSGDYLNSLIDELRIDKVQRTADEIAAWYYSNSPFWPRGIYRKPY